MVKAKYFRFFVEILGLAVEHKTLRRHPGRLLNVLSTSNLRLVSRKYIFESVKIRNIVYCSIGMTFQLNGCCYYWQQTRLKCL